MSKSKTHVVVVHRDGRLLRAFGPFTQSTANSRRKKLLKLRDLDYPGQDITVQTCQCWSDLTNDLRVTETD